MASRGVKMLVGSVIVAMMGLALRMLTRKTLGELQPVNLAGRTFIVTGATSGLGRWQAEVLAEWNATLVLPVRDVSRGNSFATTLRSRFPNAPRATVLEMDLNSFASVRKFAETYQGPVDVLVHNAALMGEGFVRRTTDGFEECFQVNYLSHVLLTSLLLERIEQSKYGRIVHVSADAHVLANISVDAMRAEKVLGPDFVSRQGFVGNLGGSYADSKLAQMLFSSALSRRLTPGVVTHSLHPAVIETGLVRDLSSFKKSLFQNVLFPLGLAITKQTEEDAAKTQIHVSTHPSLQAVTGRYYSNLVPPLRNCGKKAEDCAWDQDISAAAKDEHLQEEVFKASCDLLELSSGMCSRPVKYLEEALKASCDPLELSSGMCSRSVK